MRLEALRASKRFHWTAFGLQSRAFDPSSADLPVSLLSRGPTPPSPQGGGGFSLRRRTSWQAVLLARTDSTLERVFYYPTFLSLFVLEASECCASGCNIYACVNVRLRLTFRAECLRICEIAGDLSTPSSSHICVKEIYDHFFISRASGTCCFVGSTSPTTVLA